MIEDISKLNIGDKVHYQPSYYSSDNYENGIIKEIRKENTSGVWVVYNCNREWHRFMDFTSALTNLQDLKLGWK